MKVVELRAALKQRGLDTVGLKKVLEARLKAAISTPSKKKNKAATPASSISPNTSAAPKRKRTQKGKEASIFSGELTTLAAELVQHCLAHLDAASIVAARRTCVRLAKIGSEDKVWATHVPLSPPSPLMFAYEKILCIRNLTQGRNNTKRLVAQWSPGTPESGRNSDAKKVLNTVGLQQWDELAVQDANALTKHLAELFPYKPFFRLAVRNALRSCGQHAAYPDSGREIVVMVGRPSSGKTKWAEDNVPQHLHVRLRNLGTNPWVDTRNLVTALEDHPDRSIVLDGRHSNPVRHRASIMLCAEDAGVLVRVVHIDTAFKTCRLRNGGREREEQANQFEFSAYQQWFVEPSVMEGAAEVLTVETR